MLAELAQHGAQELQQVRAIAPEGIAMVSMVEVLVRSWRSSSRIIAIWSSGCAMERTPVLWRAGLLPRGGGPVLGGALQASRLRALGSGLITVVVSLAHLLPFRCGLVTSTLDDPRLLAGRAYCFISTSSPSAQARATLQSAFSSPGILSQPPFSMKVVRV
jgi:hypothetical protein